MLDDSLFELIFLLPIIYSSGVAIKNIGHNINKTKDKLPLRDSTIPKPRPSNKVAISVLLGKYAFMLLSPSSNIKNQ
ncbi:MAG: hypothetical protein QG562_261 [Patescibacteria group bacterium]|nr:hypothetical protein [Patescibacteria group bacterium]MDQ5953333.1 hypothetical protein [Patescibacteria group bacterium]MDQ5958442.1 hypothetical protein [Patescibacteria group bacterium]